MLLGEARSRNSHQYSHARLLEEAFEPPRTCSLDLWWSRARFRCRRTRQSFDLRGRAPARARREYGRARRPRTLFQDSKACHHQLGSGSRVLRHSLGVLHWILPIPNGKQVGTVEIAFSLHDRSGAEVWADRLAGASSRIYSMWNGGGGAISSRFSLGIKRYGANDEGVDGDSLWAYYASALRTGMGAVKESLALFLAEDARSR